MEWSFTIITKFRNFLHHILSPPTSCNHIIFAIITPCCLFWYYLPIAEFPITRLLLDYWCLLRIQLRIARLINYLSENVKKINDPHFEETEYFKKLFIIPFTPPPPRSSPSWVRMVLSWFLKSCNCISIGMLTPHSLQNIFIVHWLTNTASFIKEC